MPVPVFQVSIDTKTLADYLRGVAAGQVVRYGDLSRLIGRDVQRSGRHALVGARRVLQREAMEFEAVAGVGIKRLSDSEIARLATPVIKHIGRAARRGLRRLSSVRDFASLPNEDKVARNAGGACLGAIAHFSDPRQVKRIEGVVTSSQTALPPADTVQLIADALKGKGQP